LVVLQRREKAARIQDPVEKREEMERMREHIYNTQDTNRGTTNTISPLRIVSDELTFNVSSTTLFLMSIL
jgi:hypothetical protein